MSYVVMDAEKATHKLTWMAGLLDVPRSGYYAWKQRQAAGPGPRAARREQLTELIREFHVASDGVNGSPRIRADLLDAGERVSRKTVAKLMRDNGIRGISPATWHPTTTVGDGAAHSIPDLVGRRFDRGALDVVWTSDITYLRTGEGWLYLCAVRDGHSRRVIGWAVDDHLRTDLSRWSTEQIAAVAAALNGRPRKVLGWQTPAEVYQQQLSSTAQAGVATTP